MTTPSDTIVAAATPPGRGGIGIVRVSGPATAAIALGLLGRKPVPRHATLLDFLDAGGEAIDAGIALWFPGPESFTGEDVLELHGHGGPVVMDLLAARALELGARPARAGEFTERAFLQRQARPGAGRGDRGPDRRRLRPGGARGAAHARRRFLARGGRARGGRGAAARVRRGGDRFPDEDIELLASEEVRTRLADIRERFRRIGRAATAGRALRDGLHVVIAGRPNAGKSSLLNALAGFDAAIVTDIPGTTRDVLRERIHVDGMPIHVVDTAGLRDSTDVIEAEGVRRARAEAARADLVLYVVDATAGLDAAERAAMPAESASVIVWNKTDLPQAMPAPALARRRAGRRAVGTHRRRAAGAP